ncbi:MAG: sulfatase-like hydrolase/transferase [Verrucomicrobia bacterium]|nr:MAG: sulfatase-like hydrolase/transferase [Verrucomicrobiota bacterium]
MDKLAAGSLLYTRGYTLPVCSPSLATLLTGRLLKHALLLPKALSAAGHLTFQTGKLWNTTFSDVGFTAGMTGTVGRHAGAGLKVGREGLKPIYNFIEDARAKEKPFFVWYAPLLPHDPHTPPERLLAKYRGQGPTPAAEKYYAMVEWFDETCGKLDDYLAKDQLTENTVIL